MRDASLFTVGIVAYKNYRYVKEAIDSVFMQNYGDIEIIVSNDGSDDFDEAEVLEYLSKNKTDNIKKIQVNNNDHNLGTCKHLNKVKSMASGQYIMFMAADDAFYDQYAVSNIVGAFRGSGEPLFVCGACGMYDVNMQNCEYIAPVDSTIEKIVNLSPEELFRALSTDMFVPTAATTYNMNAFDILGDFDERVFLVEDWAFFLRAFRSGYKPFYLYKVLTKHRGGGVAHGNKSAVSQLQKKFIGDEIVIMEIELLPYGLVLGKRLHKRLKKKHQYLKVRYNSKYNTEMAALEKVAGLIKSVPVFLPRLTVKGVNFLRNSCFQPQMVLNRLVAIAAFVALLVCINILSFNIPHKDSINNAIAFIIVANILFYLLGVIIGFAGLLLEVARTVYRKVFKREW